MSTIDPKAKEKTIILLAVSCLLSIALAFILSRQTVILIRSDHFSRWYATYKLVTEGRSIYDPENGKEIVSLNQIPTDPIEGTFFYPAHVLALTLPLVWLPYPIAHFIWLVLIQFFTIFGIFLVWRVKKWPDSPNQFAFFLLLSILFIPNIQNTIWGQFNTLALISLALVYISLIREHYGLAGLFAIGLTFKPQNMLLTLACLLIWALFERRRWAFLLTFSLGCLVAWAFGEWFEPGWMQKFLQGVRAYNAFHTPQGVLSIDGWLGMAIRTSIILIPLALFLGYRDASPDSLPFTTGIVISLGAWWIVVPVLGMMHLVALPLALVLLLASLKKEMPELYRVAAVVFLGLYFLGLVGFIYGLSRPELYGLHIRLSEFFYKTLAPLVLALLAVPLALRSPKQIQKSGKLSSTS
jgi:hypothetical protein